MRNAAKSCGWCAFHTLHCMCTIPYTTLYIALEHALHTKSIALTGAADTKMAVLASLSTAVSPQIGAYSLFSTFHCDLLAAGYMVSDSTQK
ncbi:hypothetical protein Y032_0541g3203 [Ancylostoma ceylanicum]|uniref:Uncharacterized protein n=1 Tax=Ancylostoma ceylanicum TaxID=53326 RepID=A0A016WR86_9BILA|nr:hypothetical protein Y032_0541g3203 [Ancylostoma ceylanicum]